MGRCGRVVSYLVCMNDLFGVSHLCDVKEGRFEAGIASGKPLWYDTRAEAETAAFMVVTKHPKLLGEVYVEEWAMIVTRR